MDNLLSLSQAARLVGVRRKTLQKQIQGGVLTAFEGYIYLSELRKEYPDAVAYDTGMIEKTQRIQDGALHKFQPGYSLPSTESLAAETHRLRLQLVDTRLELEAYRTLSTELQKRLYAVLENCDRREGALLNTLVAWYGHQLKQRH